MKAFAIRFDGRTVLTSGTGSGVGGSGLKGDEEESRTLHVTNEAHFPDNFLLAGDPVAESCPQAWIPTFFRDRLAHFYAVLMLPEPCLTPF